MKKIIILLTVLMTASILIPTTEAQSRKRNYVLEKRDISDFTKLDISGGFAVHLMQTDEPSLEIEAPDHVVDDIKTSVKNGRLYISHKHKLKRLKTITLHIGFQKLEKIKLEGGISLSSDAPIQTEVLDLDLVGGINLDLEVNTEDVYVTAEGGMTMLLCGKTTRADFHLEGAGNLSAFCLVANEMKLEIEGAGKANVHVMNDLEVEIDGVGTVKYKGYPRVKKHIDGIASIRHVED